MSLSEKIRKLFTVIKSAKPDQLPIPEAPIMLQTSEAEVRLKLPIGYTQASLQAQHVTKDGSWEPVLWSFSGTHTNPDETVVVPEIGTNYPGEYRFRIAASSTNQLGKELIIHNHALTRSTLAPTPVSKSTPSLSSKPTPTSPSTPIPVLIPPNPTPLPVPPAPKLVMIVGLDVQLETPPGYSDLNTLEVQLPKIAYQKVEVRFPGATIDTNGTVTIPGLGTDYPNKILFRIAASTTNAAGEVLELINPFVKPTRSGPATGIVLKGTLPIRPYRVYQEGLSKGNPLQIFDAYSAAQTGPWLGESYDPHIIRVIFDRKQAARLASVTFLDGAGMLAPSKEVKFFYKTFDSNKEIYIGQFTGAKYLEEDTIPLPKPTLIREFIIRKHKEAKVMPQLIRLNGSYRVYDPPKTKHKPVKLKKLTGINLFTFNIQGSTTNATAINPEKLANLSPYHYGREFVSWAEIEAVQGKYTLGVTHPGGRHYDAAYTAWAAKGGRMVACLDTPPAWLLNTYPEGYRQVETAPFPCKPEYYSFDSDGKVVFTDNYFLAKRTPSSYLANAKAGFQLAARWGNNPHVDPSLVSVDSSTRWASDEANEVKIGMNICWALENGNEYQPSWKPQHCYQSPREYAANMSAFYDGHKNTLGPGVGAKNADPNLMVIMGGMASKEASYIVGMVEWCRENRGYRPDGSVNICWDALNYHIYSNNAGGAQYNDGKRIGVATETSGVHLAAITMLQVSAEYCGDIPVFITETGWDWKPTPQSARAIGNRSAIQTQADWSLRNLLLHAPYVSGFWPYQAYDDRGQPGQYGSSGHLVETINENKTRTYTKRPIAWFTQQLGDILGEYAYQRTVSQSPRVDVYSDGKRIAYLFWMPTESGATDTYPLVLPNGGTLYQFSEVDANPAMTRLPAGSNSIAVTETPCFVIT